MLHDQGSKEQELALVRKAGFQEKEHQRLPHIPADLRQLRALNWIYWVLHSRFRGNEVPKLISTADDQTFKEHLQRRPSFHEIEEFGLEYYFPNFLQPQVFQVQTVEARRKQAQYYGQDSKEKIFSESLPAIKLQNSKESLRWEQREHSYRSGRQGRPDSNRPEEIQSA